MNESFAGFSGSATTAGFVLRSATGARFGALTSISIGASPSHRPALHRMLGYWPDLTAFNDLVGNATLLAVYLALNWVLAAFGEETVWRGYALPRAAEFFGSGRHAFIIALVVVNAAFGLAHLYQGPSGVIQATVGGLLLGILYLATGRNLVAPIVAHGVGNSIDFTVMYFGLYPGVGS